MVSHGARIYIFFSPIIKSSEQVRFARALSPSTLF